MERPRTNTNQHLRQPGTLLKTSQPPLLDPWNLMHWRTYYYTLQNGRWTDWKYRLQSS
jgi:hypothetical protein